MKIILREKLIQYTIVQAIDKGCYGYAMTNILINHLLKVAKQINLRFPLNR